MSLVKVKLLEWLDGEIKDTTWPYDVRFGFIQVRKEIESGTFDSPHLNIAESDRKTAAVIEEIYGGGAAKCDLLESTQQPEPDL